MPIKILSVLLSIFIFFTACNNYESIGNDAIKNAFVLNSSATFKGYYYKGSDDSYHYFVSKWDLEKDRYFKIPLNGLTVKMPYQFNANSKETSIDLFNQDSEEFAGNQFYKLYLVKGN